MEIQGPALYLDHILQPLVASVPHLLKDTTHFIKEIEGKHIEETSVLVTLDVNSLYTSISHDDVCLVIDLYLDGRQDQQPLKYFLLELLDLIIEKNYFTFEGDYFYQTKGVAMGCAAVPSIANLFMAWLEEGYILNPNKNPFYKNITHYHHFIDDLFFLYWEEQGLQQFLDWLDEVHPSISFADKFHHNVITYLDMVVFRDNYNHLAVRLYKKPTDTSSYLNFRSFHPFS